MKKILSRSHNSNKNENDSNNKNNNISSNIKSNIGLQEKPFGEIKINNDVYIQRNESNQTMNNDELNCPNALEVFRNNMQATTSKENI